MAQRGSQAVVGENCPEAIQHGPPDGSGRCPWCRRKITAKQPMPDDVHRHESRLSAAYRRSWDPDWGTDPLDDDPW